MSRASTSSDQLEGYIQQLEKHYKKEVHEIQIMLNNDIKLKSIIIDQISGLLKDEKDKELKQSMKDYIASESEKVKHIEKILEKILKFSNMQRKKAIKSLKRTQTRGGMKAKTRKFRRRMN